MSEILTPDICVIGAGSGGLTVAAVAAMFNVDVVLIEKGKMGGDCLNYGCVPSKALIAAGKSAHNMRHASKFGIADVDPSVNFGKVHDHVQGVIDAIAPNDSVERFTGLGVNVIEAAGTFVDKRTVKAGDKLIRARRFVIATGSSAFVPPVPGLDDVPYLTNETIFEQTRKPEHLIIIGGGPIGMELAQAHQRLGSKVTVVEMFKALGKDDPELTEIVLDQVRQDGVEILDNTKVVGVAKNGKSGVRVSVESVDGEMRDIAGSHLLVAAGRKPNTDGLGLDDAGIKHDRPGITVDKGLRTSNRRVYAIGDVAGSLQFTHVAGYHAGLVIRSILFRMPIKTDISHIPWSTYTDPEIAHVGLTAEMADATLGKGKFKVYRWPFAENDRAQAERKTAGLVKIVTDPKGRILGATIVGSTAGEMISMYAMAISQKLSVKAFAGYVAPYPTLTEATKRVAVQHWKGSTESPWLQRLLKFLRLFG